MHVSTEMLFIRMNRVKEANMWARANRGGEYAGRLIRKLAERNLRFAYTSSGNEEFLKWAVATRRGCGIFYKPNHAILLIGREDGDALLLDNNNISVVERVPWDVFVSSWKSYYGGFAWAVVDSPIPPKP